MAGVPPGGLRVALGAQLGGLLRGVDATIRRLARGWRGDLDFRSTREGHTNKSLLQLADGIDRDVWLSGYALRLVRNTRTRVRTLAYHLPSIGSAQPLAIELRLPTTVGPNGARAHAHWRHA